MGRLDRRSCAIHRSGGVLAGGAALRSIWQASLAPGLLSALLTCIGQSLYTYSYDYKHAALGTLWPSDFLVFFWIVPVVMTLFLSVRDSDTGLEWLRFFDFVQVCTLALAIELTQIYVPSRWQASGQSMQLRALHAGMLFFGLLAVTFLVRGLLSENRTEKAFFLRMGGFLVVYGIVLNVTLSEQAGGHYVQGTWLDLTWTIGYVRPDRAACAVG